MVHSTVRRSYRSAVLLVAMLTGLAVLAFIGDPAAADPPWQPNVFTDGNGTCDDYSEDITSTTILTECTLREAIMYTNANTGPHTINLEAGTYELSLPNNGVADDSVGDLDVESGNDLTIVGQGQDTTIIDASQITDRVFEVDPGASLTLQNLTVTGGNLSGSSGDYYGGGINNQGTLIAQDVAIDYNSASGLATYYGGGLHNAGTTTMTGGSVSGNSVDHYGGGISNFGTLTLNGVDVTNNNTSIGGYGGGVYNTGTANLLADTEVESNAAGGGGGVYNHTGVVEKNPLGHANEGMLIVDASSVSGNYAWDYSGGGIYNYYGTVTLTNAAINANYAYYYGGGIYNDAGVVSATDSQIGNSNLEECYLERSATTRTVDDIGGNCAMEGGGLHNFGGGMVTLTNTTVEYNTAFAEYYGSGNGGGIYNGYDITNEVAAPEAGKTAYPTTVDVIGGTISHNTAGTSGGGAYDLGTMTLSGASVDGNRAGVGGGILTQIGPNALIKGCGADGQGGGGLYICYGSVTATDTSVVGNTATLPGLINGAAGYGNGGGISNYEGALSFSGGEISGNDADSYGGGLYNHGSEIVVVVPNAAAARDGHIVGHSLLVSTVVAGNEVGGGGELPLPGIGGGGVYNYMGQVDIVDTTIDGNRAGVIAIEMSARQNGFYGNGGGVHNVEPGEVNIDGSTISNNVAINWGGGIYNQLYLPNATVHALNSTISGNDANVGGGIFNEGTTDLDHVTVTDNTAAGGGGGVFNGNDPFQDIPWPSAVMDLASSIIAGNDAGEGLGPDCWGDSDSVAIQSSPTSFGGNLIGDDEDCEYLPDPSDIVNDDAELGPLADNGGPTLTHLPAGTSPAVDLATASTETEDQRDEPRPRNAANDSGAVEVNNPIAVDDSYAVDEEATLVVAAPGLLGNDTGGQGPLSAAVLAPPSHGTLALAATGTFTYTPTSGFVGTDTFTYTASDTNGGSDTATVTITVNDIGAPVAVDDSYAVDEEATLTVASPGVLGNDTGVLGLLTAAVLAPPSHGTLALAADGSFVYTPTVGFLGMDTFTYAASDSSGSDTATVEITVNDIGIPGPGVLPNFFGNPETVGLYDDDTGLWRLRNSAGVVTEFYFGNPEWQPVAGNWNGDAHDTPGLYNDAQSTWYLRNSNTQGIADRYFLYGDPGDYAIVGDWDGDGVDTPGVVRGDTVYLSNKLADGGVGLGPADLTYTITGISGGRPFAGDFNGDGTDEVGFTVPDPAAAALNMYFRTTHTSGPADYTFLYGNPEDLTPNFGDWNDDFVDGPAVYRPAANWGPAARHFYLRNDNSTGIAQYPSIPPFGEADDLPVSGRWGLG